MNPDELRALADALEPMAKAPRFEDFDVPAFCAWVRACADAKPVAWVDVTDSYEGPYIFRGKELLPAGRHDLYTHPAPAVPHPSADASRDAYEGCREDLLDWKRRALKAEREARNLAKALADTVNRPTFMGEPAAPQAEPTRDPNPDEVICPACTHQFRAIPENVQAQLWAKREPLSDERIELPDYLLLQIASTAAAHDVLVERRRQIESEGWAPEHDDEHSKGQLAAAAACYALSSIGIKGNEDVQIRFWPWDDGWWRPSHRRRDLVKAGALILAEIERLDR